MKSSEPLASSGAVTELLSDASGQNFHELIRLVYEDLRRVAANKKKAVFKGMPSLTMQTTEVVHEAVMKLMKQHTLPESRAKFFGVASIIISRVLLDYARRRMGPTDGSGSRGESLADDLPKSGGPDKSQLPVEYAELLEQFSEHDPRSAEIFSLCTFAGYTQPEAAKEVGISLAQAERDMAYARKWWRQALREDAGGTQAKS